MLSITIPSVPDGFNVHPVVRIAAVNSFAFSCLSRPRVLKRLSPSYASALFHSIVLALEAYFAWYGGRADPYAVASMAVAAHGAAVAAAVAATGAQHDVLNPVGPVRRVRAARAALLQGALMQVYALVAACAFVAAPKTWLKSILGGGGREPFDGDPRVGVV